MTGQRVASGVRYLLFLLLFGVLYFATGNAWLLGLCILTLLLPPASLWANHFVNRRLRLHLLLPATTAKNSACVATLSVENPSWLPASGFCCCITMVNDLTGETRTQKLMLSLPPAGKVQQELLMESAHCGRISLQVHSVRLLDCSGIFFLRSAAAASARITVLPELFPCEVLSDALSSVEEDASVSQRGNDVTEVFQLREYHRGDDVRRIHWKLSSKVDTLLLKETGQSVSRSLLVFWDKRERGTPEQMDAMAEVVASVCQGLADCGITFDLAWSEGDELELRQNCDSERLLQAIPALVCQAGKAECPLPATSEYGLTLCVTMQSPALPEDGVRYLVCGEKTAGDCLTFSPEGYQKELERLEL